MLPLWLTFNCNNIPAQFHRRPFAPILFRKRTINISWTNKPFLTGLLIITLKYYLNFVWKYYKHISAILLQYGWEDFWSYFPIFNLPKRKKTCPYGIDTIFECFKHIAHLAHINSTYPICPLFFDKSFACRSRTLLLRSGLRRHWWNERRNEASSNSKSTRKIEIQILLNNYFLHFSTFCALTKMYLVITHSYTILERRPVGQECVNPRARFSVWFL